MNGWGQNMTTKNPVPHPGGVNIIHVAIYAYGPKMLGETSVIECQWLENWTNCLVLI